MTLVFIADASVAVGWVHPGQASAQTDAMLEAIAEGAAVEVPACTTREYLELALRRKLILACKDGPLRKAAKSAGVGLWE